MSDYIKRDDAIEEIEEIDRPAVIMGITQN